jgi:hypothetical protein
MPNKNSPFGAGISPRRRKISFAEEILSSLCQLSFGFRSFSPKLSRF